MTVDKGCIILFAFSCFCCVLVDCNDRGPSLVYFGQTIAEVEYDLDRKGLVSCRLYELENMEDARYIIDALGLPMNSVPFGDMMDVIDGCRHFPKNVSFSENGALDSNDTNKLTNETFNADVRWSPWSLRTGIFPGTKWCGMGDIAKTYEELGVHTDMDRCCRAHDHCPVKLKAFRAGYGLVNLSFYTKSHCECDERFYNCLKETKHRMADILGNLYFNIFKAQCLKEQVQIVCAEVRPGSNGKKRCVRWKEVEGKFRTVFVDPERKY